MFLACLLLAACGQKGNLYLPNEARPVNVPAKPQASPVTAPADGTAGQSDAQRKQQQQQTAPAGNTTNNAGN